MDPEQEQYLKAIYYDASHPASYSGLDKLYRAIKREGRFSITKRKLRVVENTRDLHPASPGQKKVQETQGGGFRCRETSRL